MGKLFSLSSLHKIILLSLMSLIQFKSRLMNHQQALLHLALTPITFSMYPPLCLGNFYPSAPLINTLMKTIKLASPVITPAKAVSRPLTSALAARMHFMKMGQLVAHALITAQCV